MTHIEQKARLGFIRTFRFMNRFFQFRLMDLFSVTPHPKLQIYGHYNKCSHKTDQQPP